MILHDRIEIVKPGGYDPYGNQLPPISLGIFPAEVQPLTTDDKVLYGNDVTITRRRVVLPALDLVIESAWTLKYEAEDWQLSGNAEKHKNHGRTHHIELVMQRAT